MKSEKQEKSTPDSVSNEGYDLKKDKTLIVLTAIVLTVVVIVAVTLVTIANPFKIRKQRLDQLKLNDFEDIKYSIQNYYIRNDELPENLDGEMLNINDAIIEKITTNEYGYFQLDETSFKLCTTFEAESDNTVSGRGGYYYYGNVEHKAGYDCITYEAITNPESSPNFEVVPQPIKN